MWYMKTHKILNKLQCCFRQGRSTIDLLTCLTSEINKGFQNKQHLLAIFFDIEKAFDTTWKYHIIKKKITWRETHYILSRIFLAIGNSKLNSIDKSQTLKTKKTEFLKEL